MSKKNIRKIKCLGQCLNEGEGVLHPNEIDIIDNNNKDKKFCPTGTTNFFSMEECSKNISLEEIIFNMRFPSINIEPKIILSFYEIDKIDSLLDWIDDNYKKVNFPRINRILNIWIKENLSNLKNYNNVLTNTIRKILVHHFDYINEKHIDKELGNYIDYWLKKKKEDDFYFNLIHDFKKFLSKKYGK
jgi:hypothetical protein